MTTLGILFMGLLIGLRHAIETDHLAAVATLATRSRSMRQTIRLGATWGVGHTLTLFLFGSVVLWMDTVIPEPLAQGLEFAVGGMLVLLGLDVLHRLWRERVHFHLHRHEDGTVHVHAHSHRGQKQHDDAAHAHEHPQGFSLRALLVGMMHGMAGSAALILLTLQTIQDPWMGMVHILVFGLGSVVGMALVSAVIAVPMQLTDRRLTWAHGMFQALIGLFTTATGLWVMASLWPEMF